MCGKGHPCRQNLPVIKKIGGIKGGKKGNKKELSYSADDSSEVSLTREEVVRNQSHLRTPPGRGIRAAGLPKW